MKRTVNWEVGKMVKLRPAGLAFELGATSYSRMHRRQYETFPLIVYLTRLALTHLLVLRLHSRLTLINWISIRQFSWKENHQLKQVPVRIPFGLARKTGMSFTATGRFIPTVSYWPFSTGRISTGGFLLAVSYQLSCCTLSVVFQPVR